MSFGRAIYEGKAKILYEASDGHLIHEFKNSVTAFNAQKKAEFEGKGSLNAQMSAALFTYLKEQGIRSHFVALENPSALRTIRLSMLPVEVVVRNILAGSLAKRLQQSEGRELKPAIVEFFLKDDAKGDPLVSEDILVSMYAQSAPELEAIKRIALRVNDVLQKLFATLDLILVDFKLEFGKDSSGQLILADEISPDTCRLWDAKTREKLDKDRFRFDLGNMMDGYQNIWKRLQALRPGSSK